MFDKNKAILELYKCVDSFIWELSMNDPNLDPPSCYEELEVAFKLMEKYEPLISEIQQAWPEKGRDCKK